jgi:hypothetical protein
VRRAELGVTGGNIGLGRGDFPGISSGRQLGHLGLRLGHLGLRRFDVRLGNRQVTCCRVHIGLGRGEGGF